MWLVGSDLGLLPAVFAVHVAAMVTPGPNVLMVIRTASVSPRRLAVLTALGVTAGGAIWSIGAAVGVQAVFARFPVVQPLIQLFGGAYIAWIGVRLWRSTTRASELRGIPDAAPTTAVRAFRLGLLTNLSNPKSLVFFGSVFATVLGPSPSSALRIAAVFLIVVDGLTWHLGLALLFSTSSIRETYLRVRKPLDRAAGSVLLFLGTSLVVSELLRR
jgi:threonine efflux protein